MKIKRDFVTNSSSSSFIVIFPKKIETIEDVKKYMSKSKAEVVFREAIEQTPIKIDFESPNESINLLELIKNILIKHEIDWNTSYQILCDITELLHEEYPEITLPIPHIDNIIRKIESPTDPEYAWDGDSYRCDDSEELKELILKNNKGVIYRFTYSDEDGSFYSEMEHGGTFNELPHIRISHH